MPPNEDTNIQYEAYKSPSGGIISRGIFYEGGKFIPFLPDDDIGNSPTTKQLQQPKPKEDKFTGKVREHLKKLLQLNKKHLIKYEKDESGTGSYPVFDLVQHPSQLAPIGSEKIATSGASGYYFKDDTKKKFYKRSLPGLEHQIEGENAANEAMRHLGIEHVLPSHIEKHHEQDYLTYPLLPEHNKNLYSMYREGTNHDANISSEQLIKHGLGTWLIHSGDRHGANYSINPNTKQLHAIDFGESWHPYMGIDENRPVHPEDDALMQIKHTNLPTRGFNLPIPKDIVSGFIEKLPKIHEFMEKGIKDLPYNWMKEQARELLRQKVESLHKIHTGLQEGKEITLSDLPYYAGINKSPRAKY